MGFYYTVKKGDYVARIAHARGIHDWRALYEHPANDGFRTLRPNPNLLVPGDQIYVPDKKKREHARDTGSRHDFEIPVEPQRLHVVLKSSSGEPYANTPCELTLGGETIFTSTNGNGELRHENLHPALKKATLLIAGQTLTFEIGHLLPIDELVGVQGRLRNLGYYLGFCHGQLDDATRAAIRRFKVEHNLGDDEELTAQVKDKLREEYGL